MSMLMGIGIGSSMGIGMGIGIDVWYGKCPTHVSPFMAGVDMGLAGHALSPPTGMGMGMGMGMGIGTYVRGNAFRCRRLLWCCLRMFLPSRAGVVDVGPWQWAT